MKKKDFKQKQKKHKNHEQYEKPQITRYSGRRRITEVSGAESSVPRAV